MFDVAKVRKDFPILEEQVYGKRLVYLDNGATTQRPLQVIEKMNEYYLKYNSNVHRGVHFLSNKCTDANEEAREIVRKFIHAGSDKEIIFTRGTTESINLVAYSYGLSHVKAGDEILVSVMEHHSNLLPWQMVARNTGATLKFMECKQDGSLDLAEVEALITEKTKIVAITQVSNVLGRVNPVKEIAEMVHRKGAVILVDGAQSTPHMEVDVQELSCDFFAFSGHKLLGPMGIGVLYGRQELLEEMPPFLSGGEMIESVTRESAVYAEVPHKFEAGTVNAAGAVGLAAAMEYIKKIGFADMQKQEHLLTAHVLEEMERMPHVHIVGDKEAENHTGIVTFTIEDVHPHDVSEILSNDGICVRAGHHCAQPLLKHLGIGSATRASFMFYNTLEEADRLIESVSTIRERMGYGR